MIWPRGGLKSTSAEAFSVACGARAARRYGLYVCRTQDQADFHVATIASMLTHSDIGSVYPGMSSPSVERIAGRIKQSPWNRNVLTTASGFTMQAYSLLGAIRGIRMEEYRPDLVIISDVDDVTDRPQMVVSLMARLAGSVLGATSDAPVILFEQNLIHHNSMMNQILTRQSNVLADRVEGGPIPALWEYEGWERRGTKFFILGGSPSWVGQDIEVCERKMNAESPDWFERECQHDVDRTLGRPRFDLHAIAEYEPVEPTRGELVLTVEENGAEKIRFYPSPTGAISIWKRAEKGHTYAAGGDTAEGKDDASEVSSSTDPDYCHLEIRDIDSEDQVATLRGQITESAFGEAALILLRYYGLLSGCDDDPFVVLEVKGGYGRVTLNKLIDGGYPKRRLFHKHLMGEIAGQPEYRGNVGYHDYGWDTSPTNRPQLIDFLDGAILEHRGETYCKITINEYKHFCYGSIRVEAEPGYHDDTVIAGACCRVAILFARKRRKKKQRTNPTHYGGKPAQKQLTPAERKLEEIIRVDNYKKRM